MNDDEIEVSLEMFCDITGHPSDVARQWYNYDPNFRVVTVNRQWFDEKLRQYHYNLQRSPRFIQEVRVARTPFQKGASAVGWIFLFGSIAAVIWTFVWACGNWERGIYAGMHYGDAEHSARNALVANYGKAATAQMTFASPSVINTHKNNVLTGTDQIRIFHVVSKTGKHYCVSVWDPQDNWTEGVRNSDNGGGKGINIGSRYSIQEGCRF